MPRDIEFRAELPKTLVGKVAYRVLEEEEAKKLEQQQNNNQKIDEQNNKIQNANQLDLQNQ